MDNYTPPQWHIKITQLIEEFKIIRELYDGAINIAIELNDLQGVRDLRTSLRDIEAWALNEVFKIQQETQNTP